MSGDEIRWGFMVTEHGFAVELSYGERNLMALVLWEPPELNCQYCGSHNIGQMSAYHSGPTCELCAHYIWLTGRSPNERTVIRRLGEGYEPTVTQQQDIKDARRPGQ